MRLEEMLGAPALEAEAPVDTNTSSEEDPSGQHEMTPSGMEIYYQWAPKRLYRIDDVEVPSVTTVLGVLDKPALVWWGQNQGVAGVQSLVQEGELNSADLKTLSVEEIVEMLTFHKLTVNHQTDKAAHRGVNVHDALEEWCKTGTIPNPNDWEEHERGYIEGLFRFVNAVMHVAEVDGMEVMVGSLENLYAGRFDLVLNISQPVEVVTKCYPKRADKLEEIPAGRYLLDLKTSKRVYPTHFLQLEAYEKASVECGYAPTDHRGVVHVTADGKYELALNTEWQFEDFLAVRNVYTVLNEREQLRNEREIESALRTELGAKDVA